MGVANSKMVTATSSPNVRGIETFCKAFSSAVATDLTNSSQEEYKHKYMNFQYANQHSGDKFISLAMKILLYRC